MSTRGITARVPFAERGGTLRGILDLATGRYPAFIFGGPVGRLLPVFHLHEVTEAALEPKLRHLAEHGYRTVTSEEIDRFVRGGVHPGERRVGLCFDDAHASLWTIAVPLLRRYGLRAITFAIPGRIEDATAVRTTIDDPEPPAAARAGDFVTWPELQALHREGVIDVQCHGYSHSKIFFHDKPRGFVTPDFAAWHPLDRPLVSPGHARTHLTPDDLGAPLYPQRSRLSDALRHLDSAQARERCIAHVRARGGAAFFERSGWQAELLALVRENDRGVFETERERRAAVYEDLDRAATVLRDRLRTNTVRYLCFPWEIAGAIAYDAARALGFRTAFSSRLLGLRAVGMGDDPWRLMRLNGKFIPRLPRLRRRLVSPRPDRSSP